MSDWGSDVCSSDLNLFRAWYVPFYQSGVIHGDPHLGNYTVRPDFGINLLDFGCIRIFPPKFVGGVIDLYRAISTADRAPAVHAYETWGLNALSNQTIATLHLSQIGLASLRDRLSQYV